MKAALKHEIREIGITERTKARGLTLIAFSAEGGVARLVL
jgi:hypothetical protein